MAQIHGGKGGSCHHFKMDPPKDKIWANLIYILIKIGEKNIIDGIILPPLFKMVKIIYDNMCL